MYFFFSLLWIMLQMECIMCGSSVSQMVNIVWFRCGLVKVMMIIVSSSEGMESRVLRIWFIIVECRLWVDLVIMFSIRLNSVVLRVMIKVLLMVGVVLFSSWFSILWLRLLVFRKKEILLQCDYDGGNSWQLRNCWLMLQGVNQLLKMQSSSRFVQLYRLIIVVVLLQNLCYMVCSVLGGCFFR